MKWIIDVSTWQNLTPATVKELKDHGLAGVIIRCAQGLAQDNRLLSNVKAVKDAGLPFGVYQWVDPTQDPLDQARLGLSLMEKTGAHFLAGDFEQYWSSWQQWYQKVMLHQPVSLDILPSQTIYNHYAAYSTWAMQRDPHFVGYCAPWFVNGWCPQLVKLLKTLPYYWNAAYVPWKDPSGDNWCSWNEFAQWLKDLPPEHGVPGVTTSIWQVNYLTIQATLSIDQDVIYSDEVYSALFGGALPHSIPIQPTPLTSGTVIAVLGLRVRTGPGIQYPKLRTLPLGAKIDIYEIKSGWGKIANEKEEWVSMVWVRELA